MFMLEVGEMRGSKKGVQRANGPLRGRASARLAKANRRFAERSQRRIYPVMADAPEAVAISCAAAQSYLRLRLSTPVY